MAAADPAALGEVPPLSSFFPLTTLLVLGVLWAARPDVLEELETQTVRFVGPATRWQLVGYAAFVLVLVVCLIRGLWWVVLAVQRRSRDGQERAKTLERERLALESLYHGLGGDKWTNRTNWLTSVPLREWRGVYVSAATGRVVKLCLPFNKLACDNFEQAGAALGQFLHLEELDLRGNALRGKVPLELCSLRRIEGLYLYDNFLQGDCPPALITNLKRSLRGIYLFNNNFENMEAIRELCAKELGPECLVYL